MDYPFIKQGSDDYQSHVASLTGQESERQVSANTIRILLLEEQNTELREKQTPPPRSADQHQTYQVWYIQHVLIGVNVHLNNVCTTYFLGERNYSPMEQGISITAARRAKCDQAIL